MVFYSFLIHVPGIWTFYLLKIWYLYSITNWNLSFYFHLLLIWQYDRLSEQWNKTRASFDEVVYFCLLYCVSRMWINNGESIACCLFLVHVQTSIHRGDVRLTDRHVFMSVLLICYSCLFQKWISISTRKTKKPPKCELCHYQFNRHKKFRVNYSFDFTIKICYRLML